jgi:hypothetical protein
MKAAHEQAVIQALRRPRYEVTPLAGQGLGEVALCRKCEVPRTAWWTTLPPEVAGRKPKTQSRLAG